jgi:Spy/CpxP family protein refolding chaperone
LLICGCIQGLGVTSAAAQSQPPGDKQQRSDPGKTKLARALDQLNLSEVQKEKVKTALEDQSLSPQQRMRQIMTLLTPEQKQQLKNLLQQDRQGSGGSGGQSPPPSQQ